MKVGMNLSNPQFKGLWGECETKKRTTTIEDDPYNAFVKDFKIYDIKKTYYPFWDESDKHIQDVRRINTGSYKNYDHSIAQYVSQVNSVCEVSPERLPITEQEYKDYKSGKSDNLTSADIEDTLQVYGLEKYINKDR